MLQEKILLQEKTPIYTKDNFIAIKYYGLSNLYKRDGENFHRSI
jgi:hypothetical protein